MPQAFLRHVNYYRRLRSELGYADMAPELAHFLRESQYLDVAPGEGQLNHPLM